MIFQTIRDILKIPKIENSEQVNQCLPRVEILPAQVKVAMGELGVKEWPGDRHNPRILEYHRACDSGWKSDEISWCSAFMNWVFKQCEIEGTRSAAARSWARWGESSMESPKLGDVVVFERKDSSWQGHVGMFVSQDEGTILVLGGNQNNEVNYQRFKKNGLRLKLLDIRSGA
jgi:uncharacterized protein (TIGR02594 family)